MPTLHGSEIRYVFTLVHGTWAESWLFKFMAMLSGIPHQQWYESGSQLRNELSKQFPGAVFHPLRWSGRNTVAARDKAAEKLRIELSDLHGKYPSARHFIIAHSHGGNIVSYALDQDADLRRQNVGVISLSTPYLHINPLNLGLGGRIHWLMLMLLPVWFLGVTLNLLGLVGVVANTVLLCATLMVMLLAIVYVHRYEASCRKIGERLGITSSPRNLLLVRAAADEASAFLLLCQVGIWFSKAAIKFMILPILFAQKFQSILAILGLGFTPIMIILDLWTVTILTLCLVVIKFGIYVLVLMPQIQMPVGPSETAGSWVLGVTEFLGMPLVLYGATKLKKTFSNTHLPEQLGSVQMILWNIVMLTVPIFVLATTSVMVRGIASVLLVVVALTVIIGPLLTSFTLGPKLAFSYVFLELAIEPSPIGRHTIQQFPFRGNFKERIKCWLNHSLTYEAPEIIDAIVSWTKDVISLEQAELPHCVVD